jgi:hypothetical protein
MQVNCSRAFCAGMGGYATPKGTRHEPGTMDDGCNGARRRTGPVSFVRTLGIGADADIRAVKLP